MAGIPLTHHRPQCGPLLEEQILASHHDERRAAPEDAAGTSSTGSVTHSPLWAQQAFAVRGQGQYKLCRSKAHLNMGTVR